MKRTSATRGGDEAAREGDLTRAYWEYNYDCTTVEQELQIVWQDDLVHHLLDWLPTGGTVLEGGCGLGRWVLFLEARGFRVIGVDFSHHLLARLHAAKPGVELAASDVIALPFPDGTFDAYLSAGVLAGFLSATAGPVSFLREARRVLKPGGRLVLTTAYRSTARKLKSPLVPFGAALDMIKAQPTLRALFGKGSHPPVPPSVRAYRERFRSASEILGLVSAAGFRPLFVRPINVRYGLAKEFPFLKKKEVQPHSAFALTPLGELLARGLVAFPDFAANMLLVVAERR